MDRSTLLWTLVVFFGASIAFRAIRRATEDEPIGVSLLIGLGALAVMVLAIKLFVDRRNRG